MDKKSYALGINMGYSLKEMGISSVDKDSFAQGVMDALAGTCHLTREEIKAQFDIINTEIEANSQREKQEELEKGKTFLEANKKNEGVKETASGLQYKVVKQGDGRKPAATDTVKVHYHGTLIDGTVFDSSVQRGEAIEFPLNHVIKGWTEGLQLMPIGSKYILYVPAHLAYGEQSPSPLIKPNSTLIFEVELLDVK
ncbi:MAG: FKBP-type peptidyl-prolyl cis-trans isomerase [Bacteroidales bacterium]|nr:FKBP-type peptidyl-prolyl cis-trans isomerase [Bacteroidales bacterium]MBR5027776.1 FKBP-type peptidyl-prolyl cis-trans isomerase [Bacteroidales bacterium]